MYVITYLCNGKRPECSGKVGCKYSGSEWGCYRTTDPEYALHGECEGDPKWYPERFYDSDRKDRKENVIFVEK